MLQQVDGVIFELLVPQDFSWLRTYGQVFCVLDRQDSGNLLFGVNGPYGKLFVKYAGAETIRMRRTPYEAARKLQNAMPLYETLAHPTLTKLLAHGPAGMGYAAVFAWQDGESLYAPWQEGKIKKYSDPRSAAYRVRALPNEHKLRMLDDIYSFHVFCAEKGYAAVDFYDGSVIVDFMTGRAYVCDIDEYRKMPFTNEVGRMMGSSRFKSPEENQKGALIDQVTNVYAMGALAFEFFGDNHDRTEKTWFGPKPLYEVAKRATDDDRARRPAGLAVFLKLWRAAVGMSRLR